MQFSINKTLPGTLGRTGTITTPHGTIETPAFVVVGTKATVKALTPEQVRSLGAQVVLANTYHLYLQPGDELVKQAGGFAKFMNWNGPTMTDSGGFQVFSLGEAFGKGGVSKVAKGESVIVPESEHTAHAKLASISEEGVEFSSHIDGSKHFFTPERSMEIQWNLGADIIFAFDECTSPTVPESYQREALDRTYRWAQRSITAHEKLDTENKQALFGVVQGGQVKELREHAARTIGALNFDGFGIGGSFTKEDMYTAVGWVNAILPPEKPRHLLGIGEPEDLFGGVENGCDTFDCVAPTRMARNGTLYTKDGKINMLNAKFVNDFSPVDSTCQCYICMNYTRAYLAHLFRANEMLAGTLASIHNLHFIVSLVDTIRASIYDDTYCAFKESFLTRFLKK
ncbi:MAG TPA: tRNA guanosine(34) transglycosylase Tgt [Candidatus Paceibacterota bacterium]|nr:tRNA guanosine(34) transglycosylase Tgt [Candidatus Paceibacterota bacterium]